MLPRLELLGFLQRTAQHEQERYDRATDEERDAPAPHTDTVGGHPAVESVAEPRCNHNRNLLARRLQARIKALVTWRRHFSQIDRHAAQLGARREALQQPTDQHQCRRQHADRCVAGDSSDEYRATSHERQRHDQPLAAADFVDIGAKHDGA